MIFSETFSPQATCLIHSGDCLDLLNTIPDEQIQLIVTSPPYNLGKAYEQKISMAEYTRQQTAVITECTRILKPQGSICWQVGNYVDKGEIIPLDVLLYPIFRELKLPLRNRIVWHYGHGLHASKRFSGRYEVILWFTKSDQYTFNLDPVRVPQKYPQKKYFRGARKGQISANPKGKNPSDLWDIPNVKSNHIEKTAHPCQFPVELVERLVLALSDEGDLVFDPFMGVGSTLIAALLHGRRALGAEIFPEYIKIAKERLQAAADGTLKIRPRERQIYDPTEPAVSIPPTVAKLKTGQK